jgi:hypothetical protein
MGRPLNVDSHLIRRGYEGVRPTLAQYGTLEGGEFVVMGWNIKSEQDNGAAA